MQTEVGNTVDVSPRIVIDEGNAAAVVLEAAQRERANLIVTGTAGMGPVGQFFMGSTTVKLVAHPGRRFLW